MVYKNGGVINRFNFEYKPTHPIETGESYITLSDYKRMKNMIIDMNNVLKKLCLSKINLSDRQIDLYFLNL